MLGRDEDLGGDASTAPGVSRRHARIVLSRAARLSSPDSAPHLSRRLDEDQCPRRGRPTPARRARRGAGGTRRGSSRPLAKPGLRLLPLAKRAVPGGEQRSGASHLGRPPDRLLGPGHPIAPRPRLGPGRSSTRLEHRRLVQGRPHRPDPVPRPARGGRLLRPRPRVPRERSPGLRRRVQQRDLLAPQEGVRRPAEAGALGDGAPPERCRRSWLREGRA